MAGDFRPPPRKKVILDHAKFHLRAPNAAGKTASLQWQLISSNPRMVVWTNDPNDTINNGKIQAAMGVATFFSVLRLIEQAANSEGPYKEKVDNKNFTWAGGKRSDEAVVESSTIIQKDEDGLITVCLSAPRRPQIRFPFINEDFHHFVHRDGSVFTKGEASKLTALAFCDMLRPIYAALLVKEYVEPPPKEDRNGGGGNRGGGGGRSYSGGGGGGGNRGGGGAPAGGGADDDEGIGW
jgi:uncharacterized membrane protein YgcG